MHYYRCYGEPPLRRSCNTLPAFDIRELAARVTALIRRSVGEPETTLPCGQITLDVKSYEVFVAAERVSLTHLELRLPRAWDERGHRVGGLRTSLGAGIANPCLRAHRLGYPLLGVLLSPMIASAAKSLSSVSVIANALRLRRIALVITSFPPRVSPVRPVWPGRAEPHDARPRCGTLPSAPP